MGWRRLRSARLSARARFACLADEGGALDLSNLCTAGEEVTDTTFVMQKNGGLQQSSEVEEVAERGALQPLADTEARMLRLALSEAKGNLSLAARLPCISRPTLAHRLKKHNIS